MTLNKIIALIVLALFVASGQVHAAEPTPWGLGMQEPVSDIAHQVNDFHNFLLVIITAIAVFVLVLLIYVMVRFNARANPNPTRTTHNTLVEVVWTMVPLIILIVIAIPSFKLLYFVDRTSEAELTVKAVGLQWAWRYEYPDEQELSFDSYMIPEDEITAEQKRLLDVDNPLVVPTGKNIRLLVTADDVLHSFAMPSMGVKIDAVPGRLNETWFNIPAGKEGMYYGQCSEICGVGHAYMPIAIKAVSEADYAAWLVEARQQFAADDSLDMARSEATSQTEAAANN